MPQATTSQTRSATTPGGPGGRKPAVLRLDRSRSSRAFPDEEILWPEKIRRLRDLIGQHLDVLGKTSDREAKPVLSLAVFGGYGSGKTSLLETLVHQVERADGKLNAAAGEDWTLRRVATLPVLKPNVDATDSFLYSFIAAVLETEDGRLQKEDESRNPEILTPVQQALHQVSEDLQVLDTREQGREHDSLGASVERLERHASDLRLTRQLGSLIDTVATSWTGNEHSVLLMPVDDADMSLERLPQVLDTYRRYLQHPRLVPVFTFMGRLAEGLLRHHFKENLVGGEERIPLEEQIATQYLAKLFPMRNRIRLGSATRQLHEARYEILDPRGNPAGEENVVQLLGSSSKLLFGCPEPVVGPRVRLALRPSALRSQLQVLDVMYAAGVPFFSQRLQAGAGRQPDDRTTEEPGEWSKVFDTAAWSLLDLHRDVLKELDLFLDEIFGWTPTRLQEAVLQKILHLLQGADGKHLLDAWRYRTEDLRSQIFSLLAVTIFRPRFEDEEPQGEKPHLGSIEAEGGRGDEADGEGGAEDRPGEDGQPDARASEVAINRLDPGKGLLWFLDLWTGFYLPQIVHSNVQGAKPANRTGESKAPAVKQSGESNPPTVSATGWGLVAGHGQAMREAVEHDALVAPGLIFLKEPGKVAKHINVYKASKEVAPPGSSTKAQQKELKESVNELRRKRTDWDEALEQSGEDPEELKNARRDARKAYEVARQELIEKGEKFLKQNRDDLGLTPAVYVLLGIWSYHGFDKEGSPWAAASFWRGLGLLGRLLVEERRRKSLSDTDIQSILRQHLQTSRLTMTISKVNPNAEQISFGTLEDSEDLLSIAPNLTGESQQGEDEEVHRSLVELSFYCAVEQVLEDLAEELGKWLRTPAERQDSGIAPFRADGEWRECFLRRLHGDSLLSELNQDLERSYFDEGVWEDEGTKRRKTMETVLRQWTATLIGYWEHTPLESFLNACPLLEVFSGRIKDKRFLVGKGQDGRGYAFRRPGLQELQTLEAKRVVPRGAGEADRAPEAGPPAADPGSEQGAA